MGANKYVLAAVLAAMGAGSTPTPSYSLDFTTTLPSQVTLTRAGSRTAVVAGVVTTVGANTAAIESTSAGILGLSIEPASTNQLLQSNAFTTTWSAANVTPTSGQTGPDGGSTGWDIAETTASNYHELSQNLSGVGSGVVMCTSVYIKAKSGAATNAVGLFSCNQFNNAGARTAGMVDGTATAMSFDTAALGGVSGTFNSVSSGAQKLANGWTRIWCTATTTSSGTKTNRLRSLKYAVGAPNENFPGLTTDGYQVAFAQTEYGVSRPTSYKATTTATVSTSADSAIISDLTWLNAAQGTLVIEHDCTSGVLLGSGANTVLSGAAGAIPPNRITGKVALAWSGTTSDLVYNGGSSTSGAQPTFGSDIRLLATSGVIGFGHIKSLAYYPTRLTVLQIQALTAPTSTAPAAGTYRVASHRNVLHNATLTVAGTQPYIAFRWPANIGSGDRTKLRVSASNWFLNDASGDNNTGNAYTIESVAIVRLATNEEVPIFWSGSRSVVVADGTVKLNSDDVLPSAFASLAAGGVIPDNDQFEIRGKVKCATGAKFPVGRWGIETGAQVWTYDASVITVSAVDATGAFTATGGAAITPTKGFSLILEGPFAAGDPITVVGLGDSIVEGVGSALVTGGTWFQNAANALGMAYLQIALGGQSQIMFWKSANASQYYALANLLVDNTGINTQGGILYYPLAYQKARTAGVRYILRPSLNVTSNSTGSVSTLVGNGTTATVTMPSSTFLANIGTTGTVFQGLISGASPAGFNTDTTANPNGIPMTITSPTTCTFASTTNATATGTILLGDLWRDNGNQTATLIYPDTSSAALSSLAANGFIEQYYRMDAVRDTGDKWVTNGTNQTYTVDGKHQTAAGNSLMATELQAKLAAITLI